MCPFFKYYAGISLVMSGGRRRDGSHRLRKPTTPAPRKSESSEPPDRASGFRRRHESSKPPEVGEKEDKHPDSVELGGSTFLLELIEARDRKRAELARQAKEEGREEELPPTQHEGFISSKARNEEQREMERFEISKRRALIFESALVHEQTLDEQESKEWLRKAALFLYLDETIQKLYVKACASSAKLSFSLFHDIRNLAHRFALNDIFSRHFHEALQRYENRLAGRLETCVQIINDEARRTGEETGIELASFEDFYKNNTEWKTQMNKLSFEAIEPASDGLKAEQEEAIEEFGAMREVLHKGLSDSVGMEFGSEERTQWIRRGTIFLYLLETVQYMHKMAGEMDSVGSFCVSQHIREMVQTLLEGRYFERGYQTFEDARSKRKGSEVVDGIQTEYEAMHDTIQQCVEYFGL